MITESVKTYHGVLCSHCNQPILVSAKIVRLQEEIKSSETNVPHTFIARCKLCEYEGVYAISEIRTFEGEPRRRLSRTRAAGA